MGEWISVADSLPDEDTEVVVITHRVREAFIASRKGDHWDADEYRLEYETVSHWMPLPPMPEDD